MATTLLWGAPSAGKSYYATLIAIIEMLLGRRVFSSYPIVYTKPLSIFQRIKNLIITVYNLIQWFLLFRVHKNIKWYNPREYIKNKVYSTFEWKHEYVSKGLNDCCIIIDEGYLEFNCHDKLPVIEHTFFATSGHNDNDIYIIAQNYARINVAIRELANYFVYVTKFSNPFSSRQKSGRKQLLPLFFTIETYIKEEDFKYRNINKGAIYEKKREWFNKDIASAYDTQYYRLTEQDINPRLWIDIVKEKEKGKKRNSLGFNGIPKEDLSTTFPELLEE
jgi:hypothetical protein